MFFLVVRASASQENKFDDADDEILSRLFEFFSPVPKSRGQDLPSDDVDSPSQGPEQSGDIELSSRHVVGSRLLLHSLMESSIRDRNRRREMFFSDARSSRP